MMSSRDFVTEKLSVSAQVEQENFKKVFFHQIGCCCRWLPREGEWRIAEAVSRPNAQPVTTPR